MRFAWWVTKAIDIYMDLQESQKFNVVYMDEIFTGDFASLTMHFVNICPLSSTEFAEPPPPPPKKFLGTPLPYNSLLFIG
jgi:hypothetical protein